MRKMRNEYNVLVEKPKRKKHLEDPGVDGRIMLKWILNALDVRMSFGFNWPLLGTSGRLL
jgi:hypothetical protein